MSWMRTKGLSECQALGIVVLAHRHRRYGSGMIDLKLRQAESSSTTRAWSDYIERRACRSSAGGGSRCR